MLYLYLKEEGELWEKTEQTRRAQELLLLALNREYGFTELPEIARAENGKPYFPAHPQIFFNYSHCSKGILCGVSRARIGVDIETPRTFREALARRVCHPKEWDLLLKADDAPDFFIRLWVLKEAYLKYTGEGIRRRLSELDFSDILSGKAPFGASPCAADPVGPAAVVCGQLPGGCMEKLWIGSGVTFCACGENPGELCLAENQIMEQIYIK